jgi:hypothetical protein
MITLQTRARLLQIITTFCDPYASALRFLVPRLGDEQQEEAERTRIARKFSTFRAGIEASARTVV